MEHVSVRPSEKIGVSYPNIKKNWPGRSLIFVIFQKCVLISIVNLPFPKSFMLCCKIGAAPITCRAYKFLLFTCCFITALEKVCKNVVMNNTQALPTIPFKSNNL